MKNIFLAIAYEISLYRTFFYAILVKREFLLLFTRYECTVTNFYRKISIRGDTLCRLQIN